MTKEESIHLDQILEAIDKKPGQPVHAVKKQLNIPNDEFHVLLNHLNENGYLYGSLNNSIMPNISDKGRVFLRKGGFTKMFSDNEAKERLILRAETTARKNDILKAYSGPIAIIISIVALVLGQCKGGVKSSEDATLGNRIESIEKRCDSLTTVIAATRAEIDGIRKENLLTRSLETKK